MFSDLPDYRRLFSGLVFKAEFRSKFQKLQTAFSAMSKACRDVLHHPGFRDFLKLILDTGNFLNAVRINSHSNIYCMNLNHIQFKNLLFYQALQNKNKKNKTN